MSVLIVAGDPEIDEAIVRRLLAQDDEVRVIPSDEHHAARWKSLGVHVARGDATDADLIERACINVRTIIVVGDQLRPAVLGAVVTGAVKAAVERVVGCSTRVDPDARSLLRTSPLQYVLIASGRRGRLARKNPTAEVVAEAVDAADDMSGEPRLEVDLTRVEDRALLGL